MLNNGWYNNIVGERYWRLVIIEHLGVLNNFRMVRVRCDCGNEKLVRYGNLRKITKPTKSCGCFSVENRVRLTNYFTKHGDCSSRLYSIWTGIKTRTTNKNAACISNYGGRGISMCLEWLDYSVFKKWALENGYSDSLTIDRYPNVNGNYCPENCRWATHIQQTRNRRNTLKIIIDGIEKPLIEWAEENDLKYRVLYDRIKRNWPEHRLLEAARAY